MDVSVSTLVAGGGFLGGVAMGVAARWGRFCTLGAIEDAFYGNDLRRLRAWAVAIALALLLVQSMGWAGIVPLSESFYLTAPFGLVGLVLGGLLFGIGMALTGTCAYGVLARIGGGDLRSLVVLMVIGVTAYATIAGILAPLRVGVVEPLAIPLGASQGEHASQHVGHLLTAATGLPLERPAVLLVVVALLGWSLRDRGFRASPRHWLSGIAVGLTIAAGWAVTGTVGQDPFEPAVLQSHSYVAPSGRALLYVMTFTGASLDFGTAAVFGVVAGAWATTMVQKRFRWEACDDVRELRRHMTGGAMMGVGGVLALGCSVGQGLSAASAFALSAPVAIASMLLGARLGLGYLVEGRISLPFLQGAAD